jgi:hypothetical protein
VSSRPAWATRKRRRRKRRKRRRKSQRTRRSDESEDRKGPRLEEVSGAGKSSQLSAQHGDFYILKLVPMKCCPKG